MLYIGYEGLALGNGNSLLIRCIGNGFFLTSHNKFFHALKHILPKPHATSNLLFVLKLCFDNKVFVELYSNSFFVKDISTNRIPMQG